MPIGKNGNGLALLERFIPDGLSDAATAFVESLKINTISEKHRRGRLVMIKRRNIFGERGADLINFYFRVAGVTIRYLSNVRDWRRWEASCFQMLNGDRFRAKITDARTVCLDKLPGQSLWDHMKQGTLNKRMLESAAKEYRRAHQYWRDEFGGLWSHGDPSMPNVIYDEKTRRARQRRRASKICQEINPGMPRASSRTLAISDKAKAASPGTPRRLPTTR